VPAKIATAALLMFVRFSVEMSTKAMSNIATRMSVINKRLKDNLSAKIVKTTKNAK
jgi:hypothetical protein